MVAEAKSMPSVEVALERLRALAALSSQDIGALRDATRSGRTFAPRRDLGQATLPGGDRLLVLSGWACRVRTLRDGRRQIFGFLLPGDVIGPRRETREAPVIAALTEITVCAMPTGDEDDRFTGLGEALAASDALNEHYLLRQIMRLGRLSAQERLVDWIMELRERLTLAGGVSGNSFALPVIQEVIADTLGLTSVHVNRSLQSLRREGLLNIRGGTVTLLDPARLAGFLS
jgi:CRP-like cAMP-binding protein